jgi:hypothetical protein
MNSSLSRPTALSACFGNLLPKQLNNILFSQDFYHSGQLAWAHTVANARGLARRANDQRMTGTTERLTAAIRAGLFIFWRISMVEFTETALRKMCRNPKCRSKLPAPVSNEREAFCCRSCYQSFYLHRCRVCEGPIEQKRDGRRVLCKKAACRNVFSRTFAGGRYLTPSAPSYPSKTPDFIGPKEALKPDRAWRIIAGPALTASQLHCATAPNGEIVDGKPTWDGGRYERIEAQNRKALKAHFAKAAEEAEIEANGYFT